MDGSLEYCGVPALVDCTGAHCVIPQPECCEALRPDEGGAGVGTKSGFPDCDYIYNP